MAFSPDFVGQPVMACAGPLVTRCAFAGASQDITCCETLAQLGFILCLRSVVPLARWTALFRTLSDNTGAEAGIDKLYSSAFPLSVFPKRLSVLACMTGIELAFFHIPGKKNDGADLLSR